MNSLRRPVRVSSESGQITAMLVLFSICLLLAIIAVTDISGSYLRRQAASSLADGAALSASDAAASAGLYQGEGDGFVVVDSESAAAAVDAYLDGTGAYAEYPGLDVDVRVDGHTIEVSLSIPYQLPVEVPGVPSTTTVHGSAAVEIPIY